MKRMLVKTLCIVTMFAMLISTTVIASTAEESTIMPRMLGIDAHATDLVITNRGRADCWYLVYATSGYSVDVTMTLEQDGVVIKTWTGSGTRVELSESHNVTSGHDYQVVTTSRVKTLGGTYLLSYTLESQIESY